MKFNILKYKNTIYVGYETTFVDEQGNVFFNSVIPEEYFTDIDKLKSLLINTIKWQVYIELKKTDWVVVKCLEEGKDPKLYYSNLISHREAVRKWGNDIEKLVNQQETIEALAQLDIRLPKELKIDN